MYGVLTCMIGQHAVLLRYTSTALISVSTTTWTELIEMALSQHQLDKAKKVIEFFVIFTHWFQGR